MIILDTCTLRECGLRSSSADLLRTIRQVGVQEVAVPWMVLEELAAQQAVKYQQKHEAARKASEALAEVTPWGASLVAAPDPERVRRHWRAEYQAVVDVVPTSEGALREAAVREANALPPCKMSDSGKSQKTGFRDAAIWLSAIDYAKEHPRKTVYFVSSNVRDFGDGTSYRTPMDRDVEQLGGRFMHLTTLDDVVARFAQPAEVDQGAIVETLTSDESRAIIAEAAPGRVRRHAFACTTAKSWDFAAGWAATPTAVFDSVHDMHSYRIGSGQWSTATVRWIIFGLAALHGWPYEPAACVWETRVLMSPASEETPLTILRHTEPDALKPSDTKRVPVHHWEYEFPKPLRLSQAMPWPAEVLRGDRWPEAAQPSTDQLSDPNVDDIPWMRHFPRGE